METVLVVGASRGIGLALAELHAARGDRVLGTVRAPSTALSQALAAAPHHVIAGIDIAAPEGPERLAGALREIEARPDRVLVVAGVLTRESLDDLGEREACQAIRRQFEVNALAPLRTVHALLPLLADGARIGLLTSRMGSMGDNGSGGRYGYRMSKAALNAAGVSLARDLAPRGIAVLLLHPGFVRTGMTGGQGDVAPEEAARGLVARMDAATPAGSGRFLHANGEELPW